MDISRMIKRLFTVKYFLIALVIGVTMLLDVINLFDMISYGIDAMHMLTYLFSITSAFCLLIYALNSHAVKGGSGMMLYLHFIISLVCTVMSYMRSGVFDTMNLSISMWTSIIFPIAMIACLFFNMKGTHILILTVLTIVFKLFPVISMMFSYGFSGFFPLISFLIPLTMLGLSGYFVATSK